MRTTVDLAEKNLVSVGAHPSFPDLVGFGRRDMSISPIEVKDDLVYQIGALQAFTRAKKLQHVKPHGAMYNRAVYDKELARAICQTVLELDPELILVALSGSQWADMAEDMGLRVARETFADRALNPDGSLVSRSAPGSVIHDVDEVVRRSLEMITQGKATSISGEEFDMKADSLCVHGDTPRAAKMAETLRCELNSAGIDVVPLSHIV